MSTHQFQEPIQNTLAKTTCLDKVTTYQSLFVVVVVFVVDNVSLLAYTVFVLFTLQHYASLPSHLTCFKIGIIQSDKFMNTI